MHPELFTDSHIHSRLIQNPLETPPREGRRAAVAMILLGSRQAEELLFIRRAEHQQDPWSGDVAFPGGGIEAQDQDCRTAAERETLEEIGLLLPHDAYLGPLGSISGDHLPVNISAHIYLLERLPPLQLSDEVVTTFSVPLGVLLDPERNRNHSFDYRGRPLTHPIIDLRGYSERFLWGISYRLLQKFFATLA